MIDVIAEYFSHVSWLPFVNVGIKKNALLPIGFLSHVTYFAKGTLALGDIKLNIFVIICRLHGN